MKVIPGRTYKSSKFTNNSKESFQQELSRWNIFKFTNFIHNYKIIGTKHATQTTR